MGGAGMGLILAGMSLVSAVFGAVAWHHLLKWRNRTAVTGFVWDGEVAPDPDPQWHLFDAWNDRARIKGDRKYDQVYLDQLTRIAAAKGEPRHAASDRTMQLPVLESTVDTQVLEPVA